jgi:hypothetical protein
MQKVSTWPLRIIALGVAAAAWPYGEAVAEEAAPTPEQVSAAPPAQAEAASGPRELADHVFTPSELLVEPFTATRFRITTGFGGVRSSSVDVDLSGRELGTKRDYNQGAFLQSFEQQVALLPWLALRANGTATVYSGLTTQSVLVLGSAVQLGVGGGLTAGYTVAPSIRLAVIADVQYSPAEDIDVLNAVTTSIQQREVSSSALLTTTHSTPLRAGLAGAFALAPSLGLTANARYEHTFGDQSALTRQDSFMGAAALDLDLRRLTPVPLGLLAAYQVIVPFNTGRDELWQYVNGGLFYTGRDQLVLGLEMGLRRFPQRSRITSDGLTAQVVCRYYW